MKILLNDCSVLLNLLATGQFESIAKTTGWQFAICPAVRDEVKRLRDPNTGEMVDVDVTTLINSGSLQVIELAEDQEQALYVEQAMVVDDGEAMSIAIAVSRRLELAIDDKQAVNHLRRSFPEMSLWSTPEILKRWADLDGVGADILREAIQLVEAKARYFPPKSHALAGWWTSTKQS